MTGCTSANPKCIQYLDCPDGLNDCVEQAKETCPAGYHVLRDDDVGADFGSFAKEHFAGAAAGEPHMLVTCD